MRINRLRGNVADRPIDSVVVEDDRRPNPTMRRIVAMEPRVEQIDVAKRPTYDKG